VTLGSHQTFKDALLRAVDERAAKAGLTRSEWIRRLVEKAEKRRK
jgi:metal-responsive CopG/Arc/MetJ family transcriptional regulator